MSCAMSACSISSKERKMRMADLSKRSVSIGRMVTFYHRCYRLFGSKRAISSSNSPARGPGLNVVAAVLGEDADADGVGGDGVELVDFGDGFEDVAVFGFVGG